jgi:hypothetical protein
MAEAPAAFFARIVARWGSLWVQRSRVRLARLLHGFSLTEAQSQLELRAAAAACRDPDRCALYLRHALDEARHASAFAEHAARLAGQRFPSPSAGSEDLFEAWGESRFLAFVHRGERRGRIEFEVYASALRARGDHETAQLFERLIADERHHEAYTEKLLRQLPGDEARSALRFAARREAWRAFRRAGRTLAGAVYGSVMLVLYVLLAPYALCFRLLSPPARGFSSDG